METSSNPLRQAAANWWVYVLGGVVLLLLGIYAFLAPGSTFLGLTVWFAAIILFNGVGNVLFALSNRQQLGGWAGLLALGVAEVLLGAYLLYAPAVAADTLALFIGFWVLLRAGSLVAKSFTLRRRGYRNWSWTLALGLLGIGLGFMVLLNPAIGAVGAALWVGIALAVVGVGLLTLGLRLRSAAQ